MQERDILRADVFSCIENGEIIEDYPNDFLHPSCLILGHITDKKILHVVVGCDTCFIYIITAYFPNLAKFESDFNAFFDSG